MATQLINFTIPDKLLKDVDKLAKKESKSRAEVLRNAAHLITARSKQKDFNFSTISKSASRINLKEDEAIELVDKIRERLSINK